MVDNVRKYKHLRITEDTWKLLNEVGRKNETYDSIIKRKLRENNLRL